MKVVNKKKKKKIYIALCTVEKEHSRKSTIVTMN